MLYLILCIVFNSILGVIFKMFARYDIDQLQAIVINYIVCVLTATVVIGDWPIPADVTSQPWFLHALILGALFVTIFYMIAKTVEHFGIVVNSIFQKMSLIAPALIAIFIYHESSGWMKWTGIFAAISSVILLSYEKPDQSDNKIQQGKWLWIFPALTFLGSCLIDSGLYYVEKTGLVANSDIGFTASLFLSASVSGLIMLGYAIVNGKTQLQWKNIVAGIILGVPNFFAIYLLILVLKQGWGGSIVFPVNNVGILVLTALFGILVFKEKITPFKIAGFVLSVFSIFLITFK